MSGKSISFEDKKIKKNNFHKNKKLLKTEGIDISKILVSKKEPDGKKDSFKYFVGYNDDDVIRPLCIWLPKMIGYANYFKDTKKMYFNASDNKLLKKYKIWENIRVNL